MGKKEIRDHFLTDEKIYAEFTFLPDEKETGVEFRWITPLNKKEKADFEIVKSRCHPRQVPCNAGFFYNQNCVTRSLVRDSLVDGVWKSG
jgi:hypothetical protein